VPFATRGFDKLNPNGLVPWEETPFALSLSKGL